MNALGTLAPVAPSLNAPIPVACVPLHHGRRSDAAFGKKSRQASLISAPETVLFTRNMIYKQHREIETSLSLVLCCLFSYSKISKRLEGVAYKLLLINHTACIL